MHPRNPYHTRLDFDALARSYPPLSKYVYDRSIDFHDEAAQRCLTKALLKRDFNLDIVLPVDRLCPPIPNRLNYVLWIQDIVRQLQHTVAFVYGETHRVVQGLDVGTGASAIYPLLACSLEPSWEFVATELDFESHACAEANVQSNGLGDRIHVVKVDNTAVQEDSSDEKGPHFGFERLFNEVPIRKKEPFPAQTKSSHLSTNPSHRTPTQIQFTLCNPPFYSSASDIMNSEAMKEQSAFGACTGAPVEMITRGGEARFVRGMVRESISGSGAGDGIEARKSSNGEEDKNTAKRQRVADVDSDRKGDVGSGKRLPPVASVKKHGIRWYTSMLGKMSSVVEVVDIIKELGISNYAITEFVQGQTRRWAVGWCVEAWRLSDDITRLANPNPTLQRLLPPRNNLHFEVHLDPETHSPEGRLETVLRGVERATISPQHHALRDDSVGAQGACFVISVERDTWSRSARRKRKRGDIEPSGDGATTERMVTPALVCSVVLRPIDGDRKENKEEDGTNDAEMGLEVRWMYGKERSLFESFASHISRKFNDK